LLVNTRAVLKSQLYGILNTSSLYDPFGALRTHIIKAPFFALRFWQDGVMGGNSRNKELFCIQIVWHTSQRAVPQ
jgi:hypothetical protein